MKQVVLSILSLFLTNFLTAQTYPVGSTVQDYSFTDYETGGSVSLYELAPEGGILVLEWFAWWCPFCARAAANVETGIVDYYRSRGGNPHGVPVKHIALNVQGGARTESDTFIQAYGIQTIMEDYSRDFFSKFSPGGGQPLFVIINAESGSPSASQWEVLYIRLNYAGNEAPDIAADMRPVIDSIQPGQATPPPFTFADAFPGVTKDPNGWFFHDGLGWLHDSGFPFIYHPSMGFLHVEAAPDGNFLLWNNDVGWFLTHPDYFPILYLFDTREWRIVGS